MPGPASHLRVLTPVLLACMSRLSSSLGGVHDVPPEQLFSAAECADLLERISGAQLEQGMLKGPAGGEVHDSIIRDSSIAWLPIRDGSGLEWVRERLLQAAALQAPGMVATSDPAHLDLYPKWKLQVAVYSAGSHYRWHTDSDSKRADLSTVSRMLSATVQLTDSSTLPPPSSSSPRPPSRLASPSSLRAPGLHSRPNHTRSCGHGLSGMYTGGDVELGTSGNISRFFSILAPSPPI